MAMRSGLFLPLFDELADPAVVAGLSVEAEEAGWHGVFVWDHVRWAEPVLAVADPWITLAAVATATRDVRLGPMVTPLARQRPRPVCRGRCHLVARRVSRPGGHRGPGTGGDPRRTRPVLTQVSALLHRHLNGHRHRLAAARMQALTSAALSALQAWAQSSSGPMAAASRAASTLKVPRGLARLRSRDGDY